MVVAFLNDESLIVAKRLFEKAWAHGAYLTSVVNGELATVGSMDMRLFVTMKTDVPKSRIIQR